MINSSFNKELYKEILEDKGTEYQDDIQSDMFENYIYDYFHE